MTKKKLILVSIICFILICIVALYKTVNPTSLGDPVKIGLTKDSLQNTNSETKPTTEETPTEYIQTIATDLDIPWEIALLPNGKLLVTERPGNLLVISPEEQKSLIVSGVHHEGEGGLLGLTLDPNFEDNQFLYLYLTSNKNGEILNRVERYKFDEEATSLKDSTVIIDNIPGARFHDEGRIAFGPDGYLYITTGDAQQEDLAQNQSSLAGKILRITNTGEIPQENPYHTAVYSFGHRNPQGIDWDKNGNLWASEHGRSIPLSGFDEVNLIKIGQNYGWPVIQGAETQNGMNAPKLQSGSNTTWAPGDLAIYENNIIFTGLKGESIYTAQIQGDTLTNLTEHFTGEFGRIRVAVVDPTKQWLYITTSNTDGRGKSQENDDKIIRFWLPLFFPKKQ